MATRSLLVLILAVLLGAPRLLAQAAPDRAAADEAFVLVRHPPHVRDVVTALFLDEQFFLPLAGVLRLLRIDATYDAARGVVYGHYLDRDRTYLVSAPGHEASMDRRRLALDPSSILTDSADLYVTTAVFRDVFGWSLALDMQSLAYLVSTPDTLPIARQLLRDRMRSPLPPRGMNPHAPLLVDRERQTARLGQGRYSATLDAAGDVLGGVFGLALGGEVLGGDLQLSLDGSMANGDLNSERVLGRWQFVLDSGVPGLRQARIGDLVATGLAEAGFRGLQVTNTPIERRVVAGGFRLSGDAGAGWDVELYHDGRLIAFSTGDAAGKYEFSVPLTYGAALLEVRSYAPTGEVIVERRRLPVPFSFLPAGVAEYSVSAGFTDTSRAGMAQGRVEYGLSSHFTGFAGYEFWGDSASRHLDAGYFGIAARAPRTWLGSLEISPRNLTRLSVSALHASDASLSAVLTDYGRTSLLNPLDASRAASLQAMMPLRIGNLPLVTRGSLDWTTMTAGTATRRADVSLGLNTRGVTPSLTFRSERVTRQASAPEHREEVLLSTMYYRTGDSNDLLDRILRGTLSSVALSLDPRRGGAKYGQLEVTRFLRADSRIAFSVRSDRETDQITGQLRYAYSGRSMQATSAIRNAGSRIVSTQAVRGSIGYDAQRNAVQFSAIDGVGRAGVVFHTFVDHDGNGRPDPGEPRIAAPVIRFREAVATRSASDSVTISPDLQPYRRYSVSVAQDRVPNPLWIPRDTAFSFVADPNGFKQIYVPFFVAGVVEGRIQAEGRLFRSMAGVPVRFVDADGVVVGEDMTFSTGSFYRLGLKPGEYTVEIPQPILAALRWSATPTSFRIRATPDGDIVDNVVIRVTQLP